MSCAEVCFVGTLNIGYRVSLERRSRIYGLT